MTEISIQKLIHTKGMNTSNEIYYQVLHIPHILPKCAKNNKNSTLNVANM